MARWLNHYKVRVLEDEYLVVLAALECMRIDGSPFEAALRGVKFIVNQWNRQHILEWIAELKEEEPRE